MNGLKSAIRGMDMRKLSIPASCSQYVEGTMTNTPMRSRGQLEVQPGAMDRVDVAGMNIPVLGRARLFIAFGDEGLRLCESLLYKDESDDCQTIEALRTIGQASDRELCQETSG